MVDYSKWDRLDLGDSDSDGGEDEARRRGGGDNWRQATLGGTGEQTIHYRNGDVYEGGLKDGRPHGRGIMRGANGNVYAGDWKDDKMHGRGTMRYSSGEVYEGEWADGEKHGSGTAYDANGGIYEGQFLEGKMHGTGKQRGSDGSVYEGEYKDDKPHGKGTYKWESGDVYEGEFKEGLQHGWGKSTYASGDFYEGEYEEGKQKGQGTTTFSSGGIEQGIGANGQPADIESRGRRARSQRSQLRRLQKDVAVKVCERCGVDDHHYKLRVCSGCNVAFYCSAACQKAASGSHRRICNIISELPPRDADRLDLAFSKDEHSDFDAGLRYATKYMDNLKHLVINLEAMSSGDKSVTLSAKQLSSLLRSKQGALKSVFWMSNDYHGYDGGRRVVDHGSIWKELHDLKQLRLEYVQFGEIQPLRDIIYQQKNTLMVLWLPYLGIEWHKAKCRRAFAQAVNSCKHLVMLDLIGCMLTDSDLKVMLQDLSDLRILHLRRDQNDRHEFTDNTCGLIARKCPGLQELNLDFHNQLSVRGIRKIFGGCVHLRSFYTTTRKLNCEDARSLLDVAPQLLHLSLADQTRISDDELSNIIEVTGGRTVFQRSMGCLFGPDGVSARTREKYDCQKDVLRKIWSRRRDLEVADMWGGVLDG